MAEKYTQRFGIIRKKIPLVVARMRTRLTSFLFEINSVRNFVLMLQYLIMSAPCQLKLFQTEKSFHFISFNSKRVITDAVICVQCMIIPTFDQSVILTVWNKIVTYRHSEIIFFGPVSDIFFCKGNFWNRGMIYKFPFLLMLLDKILRKQTHSLGVAQKSNFGIR